jgi:ABC-type multidrug transport system fused ATPase/permease subunit
MKNKHVVFKLLAHACIIISGMLLTFFVIDRVNPFMEFLTSEMSVWLIFVFALLTLAQSIMLVVTIRKHEMSASKKYSLPDHKHGEDRELVRAELEKKKAEADREFLEALRRNTAKKQEEKAAEAKYSKAEQSAQTRNDDE